MRLFKRIIIRVGKKDTVQTMMSRALDTLSSWGVLPEDNKFFFSAFSRSVGAVSGIDRLLKMYPDLEKYQFELGQTKDNSYQVMSNHTTKWYGGNPRGITDPLPMEQLKEIVSGIPRRYPLNNMNIVLDNLSILGGGAFTDKMKLPYRMSEDRCATPLFDAASPYTRGFYPSPCIHIRSDWWISGRSNHMIVVVDLGEVDVSSPVNPLLNINDETLDFVNQLGGIEHEALEMVPSSIEESYSLSEQFLQGDRIIKECHEDMNRFDFPYTLQKMSTYDVQTDPVSPKKSIQRTFSKMGFGKVFASTGHGYYSVSKNTQNHNCVTIIFERGKFGGDISCRMEVKGLLWKHSISSIPCSSIYPYRLISQDDCDRVIENAAAIYAFLEHKIIDEIDRLYGQAPSWFTN